jgi:hypothetical protein
MEDVGTGPGHRAPPEVLRRLALVERIAARAVSHARVADAVIRRRTPKLLRASTRIAAPVQTHPPRIGGLARADSTWAVADTPAVTTESRGAGRPVADATSHDAPVSEEAASFRAMMQERYDLPDEMFDVMFGGHTVAYQGPMPALDAPVASAPDQASASESRTPTRARPTAQPGGRGARILEGPHAAEAPIPPPARQTGQAAKRLSTRPAAGAPRASGAPAQPAAPV